MDVFGRLVVELQLHPWQAPESGLTKIWKFYIENAGFQA